MRKINTIRAATLLCLVPFLLGAGEKLRLGDFPTDAEIKEDERKIKQGIPLDSELVERKKEETKPKSAPVIKKTRIVPLSGAKPKTSVTSKTSSEKSTTRPKSVPRTAPEVTLTPIEAKNKSNEIYLQALNASQSGQYDEAAKLCREALKYDPSNLQAERMSERLALRVK